MNLPIRSQPDPVAKALRAVADLVAAAVREDPRLRAGVAKALRGVVEALEAEPVAPAADPRPAPAAIDVVAIARAEGAVGVDAALRPLGAEALKAIVSSLGIDAGRSGRWKDLGDVRRRIAAVAVSRAEKGSSFGGPSLGRQPL